MSIPSKVLEKTLTIHLYFDTVATKWIAKARERSGKGAWASGSNPSEAFYELGKRMRAEGAFSAFELATKVRKRRNNA